MEQVRPSTEALIAEVAELRALLTAQQATIAELERRLPQAQATSGAETGDTPHSATSGEETSRWAARRRGTSRRGLLRGAAAGAAAAAVAAVAIGGAEQAHAAPEATGNSMILGVQNDANATTSLIASTNTTPGVLLEVDLRTAGNVQYNAIAAFSGDAKETIYADDNGSGTAISGASNSGTGVLGTSTSSIGVAGHSTNGGTGVSGVSVLGIDLSADGAGHIFQSLQSQPGAPTSGLNYVGDSIRDSNGALWLCTSTGMPGTWVKVSTQPSGFVGGSVVFLPNPMRLLDTRKGASNAIQTPDAPCLPNTPYAVNVAGATNGTQTVPAGAIGAIGNVTAVNTPASGYLALVPHGSRLQGTSNVNYVANQIVPNFFVVNLASADFDIIVDPKSQPVDVLIDLFAFIY